MKFRVDMLADKLKAVKLKKFGIVVSLNDDEIKQAADQIGPVALSEILPRMNRAQKVELGKALQAALQQLFRNYNLTAKNWASLTRAQARASGESGPALVYRTDEGSGLLRRGAIRYQRRRE